ncbi:hypothetical protein AB2B41_10485 [Marimonas sp. MJW-29]|uniref:DUF3800 domain-containing protein n=1 Tax=Sulfitobacter sediminis TaxID=3234186 RepID=A0ABV3RM15_9RHOB
MNSVFARVPFRGAKKICVFQCYLDDSYDPPGTGVVTLAGYFGTAEQWDAFEVSAQQMLNRYSVPVFHAKDFKDTSSSFEGWSRHKKEDFAVDFFDAAHASSLIGVSKSVERKLHASLRKVGRSSHNYSPLGMAFGALTGAFSNDQCTYLPRGEKPTHFFVEAGNTNNSGSKKSLNALGRAKVGKAHFCRSHLSRKTVAARYNLQIFALTIRAPLLEKC